MKQKKSNDLLTIIIVLVVVYFIYSFLSGGSNSFGGTIRSVFDNAEDDFTIAASYDYMNMEDTIVKYGRKHNIDVKIEYFGDIDIVDELNANSDRYDAVWISNSMWLYMLDNNYLHSKSKSMGISPVVFGIKKSKAEKLGLIDKSVTNKDILNLIKEKKIKYVMNSVTQTNTGATAYIGFLTSLAGNPEVLTDEMLKDPVLIENLKGVFSGVERVSGDESYLSEMFINNDDYEAVISSESSLINLNMKLRENNKEELYFIYPSDGVAINDSTFAFIDNKKDKFEDKFDELQNYLLSDEGQELLENNGIRTWYGGVTKNSNKKIFNPNWGVDTNKYLNVTRFPSKNMITSALNLYIDSLRKPTHVVFCLDYSGSMEGEGYSQLVSAMDYILTYEKASKDNLQFSKYDKITVIPFSYRVLGEWNAVASDTSDLLDKISKEDPYGATALYDAIERGIDILDAESDEYTKTIIAMTDGVVNVGKFTDLERSYKSSKKKVPVYSITFGDADENQLEKIAKLSNSKVFDGKKDLLKAFKEVRSYN